VKIPEGKVRLAVGNFGVNISVPAGVQGLGASLAKLLNANPPPAPTNHRDVLMHVRRLGGDVLKNKAAGTLAAPVRAWLDRVLRLDLSAGAQGIVVGGEVAEEVRVLNNTIDAMIQGIHVGLSNRKVPPAETPVAGRVSVIGNTVDVVLPFGRLGERHGVFVGNSDTLTVERNYLRLRSSGQSGSLSVDGVRVFGRLGRMVVIRQNHLVGFNPAFTLWPTNFPGGNQANQWLVEDNMAPSTPRVVVVRPAFVGRVRQNNNLA
jgi:hypothetical protein